MKIFKEVIVRQFSDSLRTGTPVKVTYYPKTSVEVVDYGIVTKNLKDTLVYQSCKKGLVSEFEVEIDRIGHGIEIEVGRWLFGEEE